MRLKKKVNSFRLFLFIIFLTISAGSLDAQRKITVMDGTTLESIDKVLIQNTSDWSDLTDKFGQIIIPDSISGPFTVSAQNYKVEKILELPDVLYLRPSLLDEMITLLYRNSERKYLTSSVSYIQGEKIKNVPGTAPFNSLSGRLPGLGILQMNGLPGDEETSLKIRGQHTFGNYPGAAILIDGKETDIRMIDPYDIESITILKDAASTVMYGLRSSNGIVLINTKKGSDENLKINYNTTINLQQPLRLPEFLNSYEYAILYNEAVMNDDPNATPYYTLHDINGYRSGKSLYSYPNVDWVDLFVKDHSFQNRHNINISGSSQLAKYYVSAGFLYNSGIFNTDKNLNTYNTNSSLKVFNIHGNMDLKVNKDLTVIADIKAKKDKRNSPGSYASDFDETILTSLYATPNNAFQPITYKGQLGGWYNGSNPYGLLNHSGYSIFETNFIATSIDIKYDMSKLAKGLSLFGYLSMNSATDYITRRTKSFATYILNPSATIWYQRGEDTPISSSGSYSSISRNYDHMLGLKYKTDFQHSKIDASLMAQRQQFKQSLYSSVGQVYQGFKGSLSYQLRNKYLFDLAASFEGSNYFPKENRYGFFPAFSAGWLISEESFLKSSTVVNMLKFRGSVGLTGNTIGSAWATYYGYLSNFSVGEGAYFGTSLIKSTGMYQSRVSNKKLTWESNMKSNIGFDFSLFNEKLNGTADLFYEKNNNILIPNAISVMYGAEIWMPEGEMENQGYEFSLEWRERIRDFSYFISGNYSFARNTILNKNEEIRAYPWMYETGNPYGTRFGYQFDRFFTEEDDFSQLPNQYLLGTVQPGDLKFKDINDDGIIDENDRTVIGKGKFPEIFYGLNAGVSYRGFDANILFQGTKNSTTNNYGYTQRAFNNQTGNVTPQHLDRWTPGSGQNAKYPRLSLTNTNNTQSNSFWVMDNSFLRLKQAEIGYTFPVSVSRKISASNLRLFIMGTNLLLFDNIKFKDPEGEDGAMRYPNVRTISFGLNLTFK